MASTFTTNRSNRLFAPRRRRSRRPYNWMPLLVAAQVVLILISSLSSSVVTMVQAANFENTTTVTLKNTRIAAPGVQQVQGKILYNNGFVDLSTLVFSVATTGDGSDSSSSAAAAAAAANSEEFYYMDLAILEVPQICNNDNNDEDSSNSSAPQPQQDGPTSDSTTRQCDWAEAWTLGVSIPSGQKNSMGEPELWWCCTKHAMGYGACTQEQYGRLLINETLFHGQRAYLPIPSTATASNFLSPLPPEASGFGFTQAGMYTLILANCNEAAPALMVNGDTIWTSYNEMEIVEQAIPFYIILGIGYAILTSWFWYLLQNNKSSRIKLEEWIFATIALGFMEMLFRTIDFLAWGSSGANVPILSLVAMIVSAAKHSFGRCLLLMVAMGWGVVRASLARHTFLGIIAMGTTYLLSTCLFDIYYTIDWGDTNDSSSSNIEGSGEVQETEVGDLVDVCLWLSFYIDIVFMIWIPSAMCQTMHYLKTTNQLRKLERYQVLLKIMMVAVLLTIITIILAVTGTFGLSLMDIGEGNEINFFIILTFVAMVWRPNPNAREFAYAMELGTGGDDDDMNGTTDLELVADSACNEQQQSRRSKNGTYEGGGAVSIDRAEPA